MSQKSNKNQDNEREYEDKIEQALLADDHQIGAIPKRMQIRLGSYLTNLMIKNLKFNLGS